MSTPALLALADGRAFRGDSCGAAGEAHGEVVFNTAMTGYQEILTDPSYRGQLVCMTYPLIGNYGLNPEDVESRRPWLGGFIVKEACPYPSNWRSRTTLDAYMREHGIVGIQGIDTRALTRHIRDRGAQEGIISTVETDARRLADRARTLPGLIGRDLVSEVSVAAPHGWSEGDWDVRRGLSAATRRALSCDRVRLGHQEQYPAPPRHAGLRARRRARAHARWRRCWSGSPTASSSPTVPAIRRPWTTWSGR